MSIIQRNANRRGPQGLGATERLKRYDPVLT